jgi:hypothetical protein
MMRAALASEALSKVRKLDPIAIPALPIQSSRMAQAALRGSQAPTGKPFGTLNPPARSRRPTPTQHSGPTLWPELSGSSTLEHSGPSIWAPGKLPQALVPHPCNDIFSPARVPAGPVAQRIEQRASNAKVAGSSPAGTAMPREAAKFLAAWCFAQTHLRDAFA